MKSFTLIFLLTAAAMMSAIAYAQPAAKVAPKTITVVMHDPGCHWFSAGGTLTRKATAHGSARVLNIDEAALLARAGSKVTRIPVGAKVLLGRGRYVITMVGQAPDDNHLVLTVS